MIDLHAHILHGLDDGPQSLEESLAMCRVAVKDGVETIVATPHAFNGIYETDWLAIVSRVEELNRVLRGCGMQHAGRQAPSRSEPPTLNSGGGSSSIQSEPRTPNCELIILPGADIHFSSEIVQLFEMKKIPGTISDRGKCMMVEFPTREIPLKAEDLFFRMLTRGITPIISHPERNVEIGHRPRRYYQMIRMGCLGQVTAMSLTGGFGTSAKRLAEKLVTCGLVQLIASDAHSPAGRPPVLSPAIKAAARLVGEEQALKMATDYPRAILEGRRPKVPEPVPV